MINYRIKFEEFLIAFIPGCVFFYFFEIVFAGDASLKILIFSVGASIVSLFITVVSIHLYHNFTVGSEKGRKKVLTLSRIEGIWLEKIESENKTDFVIVFISYDKNINEYQISGFSHNKDAELNAEWKMHAYQYDKDAECLRFIHKVTRVKSSTEAWGATLIKFYGNDLDKQDGYGWFTDFESAHPGTKFTIKKIPTGSVLYKDRSLETMSDYILNYSQCDYGI